MTASARASGTAMCSTVTASARASVKGSTVTASVRASAMGTAMGSTVSASVRASVKGSTVMASVRASSVKVIVHEDLRHLHRWCKGFLGASNALRGGNLGRGGGLEGDGLGEGLGGVHLCRHSSTLMPSTSGAPPAQKRKSQTPMRQPEHCMSAESIAADTRQALIT